MNIPALRLHSQQIEQPRLQQLTEVAAYLGALQGQDYTGAKWSIGLRLPGSTEAQIEATIAARQIVRTWLMRGTLHLVAAEDLRWMLALLAPRLIDSSARRYRELELDAATLTRSSDLIAQSLAQQGPLTRRDLLPMLEEAGISTAGQRGVYMLQRASLNGLIYQTVMPQHNNPLFNLLDDSLPDRQLSREESLTELARRYFISRGPASFEDWQRWSGLLMADARVGFEAVRADLERDEIAGQVYWRDLSSADAVSPTPTAYLLPGFDEYVLGYRDRSAVLDPAFADAIVPGGNGVFRPTIVLDGQIIGTWKATVRKSSLRIEVLAFEPPLDKAVLEAIEIAAQAYNAYLERDNEVVELWVD
jgi:hypothetical protein